MNLLNVIGGTAVIGTVVALWSQIKGIGSSILGLFIVEVRICQPYVKYTHAYLHTEYNHSPVWKYYLTKFLGRVKSKNGICPIAVKHIGNHDDEVVHSVVYFKGLRGCLFNAKSQTVTYIRGFFDFDDVLMTATALWHSRYVQRSNRFYTRELFGSLEGSASGRLSNTETSGEAPVQENDDWSVENLKLGLATVVGYNLEDIELSQGYEKTYMDYLAYPSNVMSVIRELEVWKDNKMWYADRGISWRRGYLFHGAPGCGKSAFIRAAGETLGLPIYIFHLITFTNQDMVDKWQSMSGNTPCIALFEDIDSVFDGRVNLNKNTFQSVLSYDTFLNCIDGVTKMDGVVSFITTNNPDKLDVALGTLCHDPQHKGTGISSRPGRIDRIIEFLPLDDACRWKIAQRIVVERPDLHEGLVNAGVGDTGAQFTERCVQYALAHLDEMIQAEVAATCDSVVAGTSSR